MPIIGFLLGLGAGTLTGSMLGAFTLAALGALVGTAWLAVSWVRTHLGDAPTVERHRVLCTPFGQVADLQLEGDLETRRWSDVKRCVKPGDRCGCEADGP